MERIIKQPDLIFGSDFHLRDTIPICRTDDSVSAQTKKLNFISALQERYGCPFVHAGDVWDTWKPTPFMITYAIKYLPKVFWTIIGNHDAPQHNLSLIPKSGLQVLAESGRIKILDTCHFGQIPTEPSLIIKGRRILIWHKMVWQKTKPYPTCVDPPASTILKQYKECHLILTGDNHKTFVEEYEGRLLVNPGSMMRMDADQADHKPCVFLWYAEDNSVQQVFLPIEEGVVSREHLVVKQERDSRIDAFISKLNDKYEVSLSFENNLEQFFKTNDIDKEVKQIIYTNLE